MTDPRKQALRDLQRLGQEWGYPERLQADDHDFAERGFAIIFCGFLSVLAIGLAVFAKWMRWI